MEASRLETELPHKMAQLDIGESSKQDVLPECSTRSLRRRKPLAPKPSKNINRRVSVKPRKHNLPENANPKQIDALYRDETIKASTHMLETIYEEPITSKSGSDDLMGKRKLKRLLKTEIGSNNTKEKIKKRREKIKKLLGNKVLNRKKMTMNEFLKTLECLELVEV